MMGNAGLYVPSILMAGVFIYVIRLIVVSQNPQKRAEARARELEAERNDPRFGPKDGTRSGAA
ncbi:hypothetical protein [Catenulispora subtropica]|uniref:Uncharacterized protein n=1 Tax=Catenulispora subtropica TaxID=450798 RepID=A0ABN2SNG2_9ACTN